MHGPTALLIALGAGLVSFLSPCTLPLVPGYLAYMSGLSSEEMRDGANRGLVIGAAALFVLGFSLIFVALGATASYIGALILPYKDTLTRLAGAFIVLMALVMLGVFRVPALVMERRFHIGRDLGVWSALPLGMAFAFGWSPCIGPNLSVILALAMKEGTAQQGALLLFVYALGLGVPFLLVALFTERMMGSLRWVRRHAPAVNRLGGAVLLVMGVFLLLNRWTELLGPAMSWYADHGLNLPF